MSLDWKGLLFALVPLLAGAGITKNAVDTIAGVSASNGAASTWPTVAGRVARARIEEGTTASNRGQSRAVYTLRVSYAFEVSGAHYQGDRLSFAQPHQHAARSDAEDELRAYPVGGPVTVHYDPARPANAVLLIESIGSIVYLLLGLGLMLLLLGCWALWMVLRPKRTGMADPEGAVEATLPAAAAAVPESPASGSPPVEVRPSADGTLLVEIYEGVREDVFSWQKGKHGRWFRLIDRASGTVLLDTLAIFDTAFTWMGDGSLLLRVTWELHDVHREDLYRIDPPGGCYRNLAGGMEKPLTGLGAEVHAEHRRARLDDVDKAGESWGSGIKKLSRWFSPLGTVRCDLVDWEIAHSWGLIPRVFLTEGNEKVLDLGDWGDPATFEFEGEEIVRIELRNPGKVGLRVRPHARLGRRDEDPEWRPLSEVEAELRH